MTSLVPVQEVTPLGLYLRPDLPIDEWEDIGENLGRVDSALQWAIGDWMLYGEATYGEPKANEVALRLGYAPGTIHNYKSVAKRIPQDLRREDLWYSHHVVVAKLYERPDRQQKYLRRAAEEKWSVRTLDVIVTQEEEDLAVAAGVDNPNLHDVVKIADREVPEAEDEPDVEVILNREPSVVHEMDPDGPVTVAYTLRVMCHPDDVAVVKDGFSRLGRGLVRWCADQGAVIEVDET